MKNIKQLCSLIGIYSNYLIAEYYLKLLFNFNHTIFKTNPIVLLV